MERRIGPDDDVRDKFEFILAVLEGRQDVLGTELTLDLREIPGLKISIPPCLLIGEKEERHLDILGGVVVHLTEHVMVMTDDPAIREWPTGWHHWEVSHRMLVLGLFPPHRREADLRKEKGLGPDLYLGQTVGAVDGPD